MDIQQQIEETLENLESENPHIQANAFLRTELHRVEWLRHQASIISQQSTEIKIQREVIEQLIEDYERRLKSAQELKSTTAGVNDPQHFRVAGKCEAYRNFIYELKEVLADADRNTNHANGHGQNHNGDDQAD